MRLLGQFDAKGKCNKDPAAQRAQRVLLVGFRVEGLGFIISQKVGYTTIMEIDPKRPSLLWFRGPNSIASVLGR